jgi:hypothetical protein
MGLLAELLVRTYYESQNKTTYAISAATAEDSPSPGPPESPSDLK